MNAKKLYFLLVCAAALFMTGAITCSIQTANSCVGATKIIGVANDTGGYNNAHAENYTNTNYANSLCCSITGDTFMNSCGTTLFKLSAQTNAHIEQNNESTYSINVCMDAALSNLSCVYVDGNCAAGYSCVVSFAGSDSTNNYTNAHAGDCTAYTRKLCCTANTRPSVPTLITPTNNNNTVFSRFTYFNWSSTDPDGDAITYYWNISSPPGCAAIAEKSISTNEYTSVDKLCVDKTYNWTVKACDAGGCSAYATPFNFTIASTVGITVVNSSVHFGSLAPSTPTVNVTANTSTNNPYPLRYNNTGNVDISVQTKANAALWSQQTLNTTYLRYADENTTNWQNWTASYTALLSNFTYPNGTRELEVTVIVPLNEPAGAKNTSITLLGASIE